MVTDDIILTSDWSHHIILTSDWSHYTILTCYCPSAHLNLYSALTEVVSASVAGEISSDSSNVVELIQVRTYFVYMAFVVQSIVSRN